LIVYHSNGDAWQKEPRGEGGALGEWTNKGRAVPRRQFTGLPCKKKLFRVGDGETIGTTEGERGNSSAKSGSGGGYRGGGGHRYHLAQEGQKVVRGHGASTGAKGIRMRSVGQKQPARPKARVRESEESRQEATERCTQKRKHNRKENSWGDNRSRVWEARHVGKSSGGKNGEIGDVTPSELQSNNRRRIHGGNMLGKDKQRVILPSSSQTKHLPHRR